MSRKLMIVCCLLCSCFVFGQNIEKDIRQSAQNFIDSLTDLQKKRALLDFGDTARVKWNNLPVGLRARVGINIGNLSDEQRKT
ncbi:MAG: DUF3500 domain-containing protein [Chitinophagaceae bacterium]